MAEKKSCWLSYDEEQLVELDEISNSYRTFLDQGKTERECAAYVVKSLKDHGFVDLDELIKQQERGEQVTCAVGAKVYRVWMDKTVVAFRIGERPLMEGMNILGAHIDSPRLDMKQNPLYEDGESGITYMDTHYYGGVKKYQWVTLPLAIHGVIVRKNQEVVHINVGEKETDPVFFISDLLIHLASEQLDKKGAKVIEGEALDVIVGSRPIRIQPQTTANPESEPNTDQETNKEAVKEAVKAGILELILKEYQIEESDFLSAELEVVPAGSAKEAGFDRSMILAYGQDDRACAFASVRAILNAKNPKRTICCILSDKEEVGSMGATGMQSMFFENTVAELLQLNGQYSDLGLRRCLSRCHMLSSDVSAAYDPTYASSFDKRNAAFMGRGLVFNKYTGARGKSGSNDANPEYMALIRKIMEDNTVAFQTAELGKVDAGGGGTIAYIMAKYGMNVIDSGVAVLNMHAPWEATSKADIYEAYRGYMAFALWSE
ncbi:MAG: aminopeptidase [Lachnospiraceae bacterium]|jgi:aspartyl aminopeptidase|nr:aminopeptidase [Lachnospiraceae bacterium]